MQQLTLQPVTNFLSAKPTFSEPHNFYKIISGKLILQGKRPDGDSVAFIANDASHFDDLYRGYLLKPSAVDGSVQLRFEGIDTPELHYGSDLQPMGAAARDLLLHQILGFTKVDYKNPADDKPATTVEHSVPVSVPVQIATNALEPHGRPIAYIFMNTSFNDGEMTSIDGTLITKSVNFKMIESGNAYLLAYTSMPKEHLQVFKTEANKAKKNALGVWRLDTSFNFQLDDKTSVEGSGAQLIYPKIFRRCIDYFRDVNANRFSGELIEWLQSKQQENDMVRITEHTTVPFSALFSQVNNNVSFEADTNDIVFIEK